jgi:hypothetical protein
VQWVYDSREEGSKLHFIGAEIRVCNIETVILPGQDTPSGIGIERHSIMATVVKSINKEYLNVKLKYHEANSKVLYTSCLDLAKYNEPKQWSGNKDRIPGELAMVLLLGRIFYNPSNHIEGRYL